MAGKAAPHVAGGGLDKLLFCTDMDRFVTPSRCAVALVALLACGVSAAADTAVYRWTDAQGVVHFSATPHVPGQMPTELPNLQSADPVEAAAGNTTMDTAPAPAAVAANAAPRIVAPADKTTFRDTQNEVPVTVAVTLQPGQGLLYYLDGKAQNTAPTQATSLFLHDVWRGEHRIAVAVVDASGAVIARSDPVTVYMHQASILRRGR
ncbi:MAG: DUF4124 domain-containing protein [Nevskiaceae bacterium]|nr:MAG: DUF4124 domain-containing protein [Nevskiaceae bacterium]TBR72762.1 MAG: DUF4124 domain-containing protein [Nevskiaceae bacterium]